MFRPLKMGMAMSLVAGKGVPSTQVLSLVMTTLDKQFIDEKFKINNVHDFHLAILDIFSTINSALPGKHYDVPSRKDVEECFVEWKGAKDDRETERKVFVKFMKERINLGKLDDSTLITGLVTPPVAMAAKRAGENVPQLRMIKAIPDVVFVPSVTVLSLISVQLFRKIFRGNTASENTTPTADASPPPSDPAPIVPKPAERPSDPAPIVPKPAERPSEWTPIVPKPADHEDWHRKEEPLSIAQRAPGYSSEDQDSPGDHRRVLARFLIKDRD